MGGFSNSAQAVAADASKDWGLTRDDARPVVVDNDYKAIMTGLRNELERMRRTHDTSCMCVVSPDGDHADQVMDAFGIRFAQFLRSYDAIYRFAPDKVLLLLPHIHHKEAVSVISRLRDRATRDPIPQSCGGERLVTASFGATMLNTLAPLHDHIDNAARAHSTALKVGGNRICMWAPEV